MPALPRNVRRVTAAYPECEKLLAVTERSQTCGELLEWLRSEGLHFMRYKPTTDQRPCPVCRGRGYRMIPPDVAERTEREYPGFLKVLFGGHAEQCQNCDDTGYVEITFDAWVEDGRTIEQILADFFGIDMAKVDVERRAMLDAVRAANEGAS